MSTQEKSQDVKISPEEDIARILAKEWFVREKLVSFAFALDEGETYLSVNRPADVVVDETQMKINVEVEPRNTHTKSHAGIFTRFQNRMQDC